jgi:formate dehydrogenase
MLGLQRRPYLQATSALVEPRGEQRDEATIYLQLCRAAGVSLFGSRVAQRLLDAMLRVSTRLRGRGRQPALPQEALLSLLLRLTGQGSFRRLLRGTPHGRLRPPHEPGSFLGRRVLTENGRVRLAPPRLLEAASRLEADFERERARAGTLKLITRRAVNTHNSWTHNLEEFVRDPTNHLYMHPDDAAARGLAEGSLADVRTDAATVRVPVKLLADLMPGTVALPHGWGHQGATGLSVARRTRGVNVNLLALDGPERIERLSGMAHLTGFPVEVRPAAGAQDPGSWSGLPQA